MRIVYWSGMCGLALCLACAGHLGSASGDVADSIVLNTELVTLEGGVEHSITGSCVELVRGRAEPESALAPLDFYSPATRAPELQLAQAFDGETLTVAVRTSGTTEVVESRRDFEFLVTGDAERLAVRRAAGGAYELRYWGGVCQHEPAAPRAEHFE